MTRYGVIWEKYLRMDKVKFVEESLKNLKG